MSSKPRILIIENSRQVTGALKSIAAMASELSDEFEFIFVMPAEQPAKVWVHDRGFIVYGVPMKELSKSAWSAITYLPRLLRNAWRVRQIVRREGVAIVHSNDLYNLIGPTMSLFGSRVPYICHVRFLRQAFPAWLFDFWAKRQLHAAHRLVAVSEVLRQQLPSIDRVEKIPDRVMVREVHPPRKRIGAQPRRLLYLSNIIPGKGQDLAIAAFQQVAAEFPNWWLRFVGSDMGLEKNQQYRAQLQARVGEYGLAPRVEWVDFTNDVEREYKDADLALNFSNLESFSMTCLEAQFFGCPVVATRSGGPNEIIDHGVSGLLVGTGRVDEMVAALRVLMADETQRETMGKNGAETARRKFGPTHTTERLRALYHSMLGLSAQP